MQLWQGELLNLVGTERERDHRHADRQRDISICGHAHTSDSVVHKIGVSAAAAAAGRRFESRWTKAEQGEWTAEWRGLGEFVSSLRGFGAKSDDATSHGHAIPMRIYLVSSKTYGRYPATGSDYRKLHAAARE